MGWFSNLFGGSGGSGGGGGSAFANIFSAILSGWAAGEEAEDAMDQLKEGARIRGQEERETLRFADQLEHYRTQQRRHETSRALDSAYNQFSTVRNFAPNYVRGTGLDAMPSYPTSDYDPDQDEEDD